MEQRQRRNATARWVVLLACVTVLGPLSINIILPALPDAAEEFSVSYGDIQWVVSLHMAAIAATQLVIGPMSDRFGRRNVLLGALAMFVFGSVIASLAGGLATLILGRMIQAVGAGASVIVPRSIARDTLDGNELARTMAIIVGAQALAPAFAPVLGGFLTSFEGWRSSMVASAALGLILLVWSWQSCHETLRLRSTFAITPTGLWRQYRPLFENRQFLSYCAMFSGTAAGFYAMLTYAPKHCIVDLGLAPEIYGTVMLLAAGGFFVGTMISMNTVGKVGHARLILAGTWVSAAGISALAFLSEWNSAIAVLLPVFTYSVGNGLVYPNAMCSALQQVKPMVAGSAGALIASSQFVLAMPAIAAVGWFANSNLAAAVIVLACAGFVWIGILVTRPAGRLLSAAAQAGNVPL